MNVITYPLVSTSSLLLKMAKEIVALPQKRSWFSICYVSGYLAIEPILYSCCVPLHHYEVTMKSPVMQRFTISGTSGSFLLETSSAGEAFSACCGSPAWCAWGSWRSLPRSWAPWSVDHATVVPQFGNREVGEHSSNNHRFLVDTTIAFMDAFMGVI